MMTSSIGEAQHHSPLVRVADWRAGLGQAGMQINGVRHYRCADDADGKQEGLGIGQLRHHGMQCRRAPIDRNYEQLDQVAKRNNANHAADDQLERSEPMAFEHQDAVGDDAGDDHACKQRHAEQERKPDGAAEKLGQIGRHGGDLADDPHRPDDRPGKLVAAHLCQVSAGDDAKLGRQRLE